MSQIDISLTIMCYITDIYVGLLYKTVRYNGFRSLHIVVLLVGDAVDPEMEPDAAAQQESQESAQKPDEEEEEDETDPAILAKKQKQLAKRGVTFEAKVDPKVMAS